MDPISENPVLNPTGEKAQALRFLTIEPEIQEPEAPELPAEEDSAEDADANPKEPTRRTTRSSNSNSTAKPIGRHRRTEPKTPITPPSGKDDKKPDPPKIKPPDFREWHDFGANFVFKWLCRGYVGYVFRGIDRERVLNAAELKAIEPDMEMLSSATKPLAHMADRSSFMTKHGRAIIDSADGIEALIAVGMYANTVRRIAKSHESERTAQPTQRKKKAHVISATRGNSTAEPVREQPSGQNVAQKPAVRVINGESGLAPGFGVGG